MNSQLLSPSDNYILEVNIVILCILVPDIAKTNRFKDSNKLFVTTILFIVTIYTNIRPRIHRHNFIMTEFRPKMFCCQCPVPLDTLNDVVFIEKYRNTLFAYGK